MESSVARDNSSISAWAVAGIAIALMVGATLRLLWPADMEYKGDEVYTFERTQQVGVSEPWPWTGMNNSADVPHPGMSVWVFVGLAKLVDAHDPVALNIACMGLNVLALGLLALFIARVVPNQEREPWWWGLSLLAVNPLAVLFERKIWPPSVLPAVSVILLTAWWHRSRRSAAFAFGLIAALAAQIHPGAFFFAAGLALWVLAFDRKSMRWLWAAGGGLLGALPALPWVYHLVFVAQRSASAKSHWSRPLEMKYWVYWFTEPFGLHLQYSLGDDFGNFLRSPLIGGRPTYLVAGLHALLVIALIFVLGRYLCAAIRTGAWGLDRSPTGLIIGAIGIGYGLVLTLTGLPVYRHYLIVAAPVACVAIARVVLANFAVNNARRLLGGLCVVQASVSMLFLMFVHGIDRPIHGDYGTKYRVILKTKNLTTETQSAERRVD
jgi:hypothetical protein